MSYFEPLPAECAGVGTGLRYLPMDTIIERCVAFLQIKDYVHLDAAMHSHIHVYVQTYRLMPMCANKYQRWMQCPGLGFRV